MDKQIEDGQRKGLQTDKWMGRWTNGWTDWQTEGQTNLWNDGKWHIEQGDSKLLSSSTSISINYAHWTLNGGFAEAN